MADRISEAGGGHGPVEVLVEEPLEIRLDGAAVATTMRTPGHDFELAVGFCLAEGWLVGCELTSVRYCATGSAVDTAFNVVTVETSGPTVVAAPRLGNVTSSCGWCGTDSLDVLARRLDPIDRGDVAALVPTPATLRRVESSVRAHQELFARTGGSHAAASFDLSGGAVGVVREDIGRHNAVDKVVGRLYLDGGVPPEGQGLWVSGRASFEIVQKAWAAGFEAVVALSAASSLAVSAARLANISLLGLARPDAVIRYV